MTSALSMLNAQPADSRSNPDELEEAEVKSAIGASIAVVPLTIPLLTGPATMSTVVIYADKAQNYLQILTLVGYGVVIAGNAGEQKLFAVLHQSLEFAL